MNPLPPVVSLPRDPVRAAAVPQGRASRLLHLGRALGELAAGTAAEGVARLVRGETGGPSQWLLSPGNARRLAERLSTMRGAAMKVGQLMSMDGHGVLPPAFAEMLGGLRDGAHFMPATQLADVLEREYGAGWPRRFRRFSFEPVAAASIGQVHRAETHEGQQLALKIQYPGVRESIDSDIANLALLARLPGLVPASLDPAPLLEHVRAQLQHETDYRAEARAVTDYRARLGDDPVLWVPEVVPAHCTDHILATEFAAGAPVDRLVADRGAPQDQRDRVAEALARLAVRELFEMGVVQTDPNFGNYLFDAGRGRLALLDFGAVEAVAPERVAQLRALGQAQRDADVARIGDAARAVGFIAAGDSPAQAAAIVQMLLQAGEPLRHPGAYDFGTSDLFGRLFAQGRDQFLNEGFGQAPPADLLFLQRKFVGTFMLCTRLQARVALGALFAPHLP